MASEIPRIPRRTLRIFFSLSPKPALRDGQNEDDQIDETHEKSPPDRHGSPELSARAPEMRSPQTGEIESGRSEPGKDKPDAHEGGELQSEDDEREQRRGD